MRLYYSIVVCFFFNDTATTEIYTLSLHDALPILEDRRNVLVSHGSRGTASQPVGSASDRGASRERARSDARSQVGTRCGFSQRRWIVNLPGLGWGAQVLPVFPGRPISSANS